MLIKCPECGKEISNEAKFCIHCGYPISQKNNNTICIINGKEYDLSFLLNETEEYMNKLIKFVQLTDCYFGDSSDEIDKIISTKEIPKYLNIKTNIEYEKEQNKVHCPYCNSINVKKISGTERVTSVAMLGIFSKKINKSFKCKNCGYTW